MSDSESSTSPMEISWAEIIEEEEAENSGKKDPDNNSSGKQKPDNTSSGKQNPDNTSSGKQNPVKETPQRKKSLEQHQVSKRRTKSEVRPTSRDTNNSARRVRSTSGIQDRKPRSKYNSGDLKERNRTREKSRSGNKDREYDGKRKYSSLDSRDSSGKNRGRNNSSTNSKDPEHQKYLDQLSNANNNELDLRSIKDYNEDHIVVTDMDLNGAANNILPIVVHQMSSNSMQEMVYRVNNIIANAAAMKDTYLTVMIFQRFFPVLGCQRVEKIAEKITNSILEQREQLLLPPEKRNPAIKINPNIFKCHVTFATITYTPSWEHLWDEIRETNYKLKLLNDRLESNHFNCHIWLTKPAGAGRVQVRGPCYTEFIRREGLGETLNETGINYILKGLIRHHAHGVAGNRSPARNEDKPVPLEATSGFMMTEQNQDNRWIDPFMAAMAARIYEQQQNQVVVIDQNVDEVFAHDLKDAETQTTADDTETVIQLLIAKNNAQEKMIKLKAEDVKVRDEDIKELEKQIYSFSKKLRNNQEEVCRKVEKHEELAKAYQARINKLDKEQSKTEEKLIFYKEQYDRDQSKIANLKNSVNKLTEELQQEKGNLEEEVKYLRLRLEEKNNKPQQEEIKLRRQVEDLKHELACEQEESESLQAQVLSLQKQVEALKKKNKESDKQN